MQNLSTEHAAMLGEKLAFSREVASLRPEIDHLRAQNVSNQNLLAEKLSLQRELSAVQVNLETERRAMQRLVLKENGRHVRDADQELLLQQIQLDLTVERKERQKLDRELQRVTSELDGKKSVYEARLDAFRNKLRIAKDQLKEAQAELQNGRPAACTHHHGEMINDKVGAASRKRSIAQVDVDATIGTPGNLPATKRTKRGSALPGKKSIFSITPYLNRTASMLSDGLQETRATQVAEGPHDQKYRRKEEDESEDIEEAEDDRQDLSVNRPPEAASQEAFRSDHPLGQSQTLVSIAAKTAARKAPYQRKGKTALALDQVKEDEVENEITKSPGADEQKDVNKDRGQKSRSKTKVVESNPAKRRRRVLGGNLGKPLFDDDDPDVCKTRERVALTGVKFSRPNQVDTNAGKGALGPLGNMSSFGGLCAFSPLRRDRRAASALGVL